jgi:adenosylcobinamide-phosphate synthase
MAGALRVSLGDPATYDGMVCERPRFGDGPHPSARDLRRGLRVYVGGCALLWAMMAAGALAWPR